MPKMSALVNSQDDASSQQQVQSQTTAAQTGNNHSNQQTSTTPQSPHHSNQTLQQPQPPPPSSMNQQQQQQQQQQQNHPNSNNIPSQQQQNIQSQLYQQQSQIQPHFVPANYIQPSGPGSFYQIMPTQLPNVPGGIPTGMPGVYFSNFTANVSGYTSMQSPFLPANTFVSADNHSIHDQSTHGLAAAAAAQTTHQYRPSRRGRGRGNSYRRDFSSRQMNSDLNSAQNQQHGGIDSSATIIPQSSNFHSYYFGANPYGCIYPNQFTHIGGHSTPAQHATGTPLYGYNGYSYSYPSIIYPTMMSMDFVVDDKNDIIDDGGINNDMNQSIDGTVMQQQQQQQQPTNDEYLVNHSNQSSTPQDEFNAQQQNEFVPQHKQHTDQQQQQQQQQQQLSNEFIMTQTSAEFLPQSHQFVYHTPIEHHVSPTFKPQQQQQQQQQQSQQQEDAPFQTYNEFQPAQENVHHQQQNVQNSSSTASNQTVSSSSQHSHHHHSQMIETEMPQSQIEVQSKQTMQPIQIQHRSDHTDQVNESVQHRSKIVNDSQSQSQSSSSSTAATSRNISNADIKHLASNSVPKTQQKVNQINQSNNKHKDQQQPQPQTHQIENVSTIEKSQTNVIDNSASQSNVGDELNVQQNQQHQIQKQIQQNKSIGTPNGSINGLVQAVNEKLTVNNNKNNKTQQISSAWTSKKSTQSVAVSVVPSNNFSHYDVNVSKSNNSQSASSKSIPDEHQQSIPSKMNTIATADGMTQQSSEVQTVPVTDFVYTTANRVPLSSNDRSNVKNPVQSVQSETSMSAESKTISISEATMITTTTTTISTSTITPTQSQSQSNTMCWASLFANSSSNQTNNRPNVVEPQKKPVAKVLPYNSSNESNKTNNVSTTSMPSQNLTTPGAISYSSAASSSANGGKHRQPPTKARIAPTSKPSSSSQSDISIDESSYRLGDFMLKYKVDNNAISLRPRGLTNRSNYCYINAILQALLACPPFYNLMKSIPLDPPSQRFRTNTPTIDAVVELVREFSNLPNGSRLHRRDKGGNKKEDVTFELICDPSIEPKAIHKLWNATRNDNEGRQEDAEEFLGYVLNKLNDEMLELKKLVEKPAETVPNGLENGESVDDEGNEWKLIGKQNKGTVTRSTDFGRTPVSDIFRGELRSRLQREGDHSTDVMQPFFTLQLNIEKANSVKEALENFVNKDQLEGVTCTKTNQEVNAWQQMTLEKLPIVLILHLKWFDYKGDNCTKILKTVEFPIELKLEPKILSSSSKKYNAKQKQYKLFAVVYHDGKEASKGHYITDVYHTGYLNWIRYDDSTVKRVSEKNVLHPHMPRVPYLLYYRRSDTFQTSTNVSSSSSSSTNATTTTTNNNNSHTINANSYNK